MSPVKADAAERKNCGAADSIGCEASRENEIRRFKSPALKGTRVSWPARRESRCADSHRARRCLPRPFFNGSCCRPYDHHVDIAAADHHPSGKRLHPTLSECATDPSGRSKSRHPGDAVGPERRHRGFATDSSRSPLLPIAHVSVGRSVRARALTERRKDH